MARVKNAVEVVTLTAPGGSKVTVSAASAGKFQRKGYKSAGKPVSDGTKAVKSANPDKSWTLADLKQHASEHDIDLGEATRKDDILAAIATSEPDPAGNTEGDNTPSGDGNE